MLGLVLLVLLGDEQNVVEVQSMGDETARSEAVMPQTAEDALRAWDAGTTLRAIRVASDGATQELIYRAAFDMLREPDKPWTRQLFPELTQREYDAAFSIAHVAALKGWAVMVAETSHPRSPEIEIQKPAPPPKV